MKGFWIQPIVGLIALPGTALAQETPLTTASIAAQSLPATVTVMTIDMHGDTIDQASGFVVHEDGLIVTNWHVVRDASTASVEVRGDPALHTATIVLADSTADLALLRIRSDRLHTLALADVPPLVGTPVVVIGNPLGFDGTVSEGIISAIRTDADVTLFQVSAPLYPGASGGPVLNRDGRVVAVATSHVRGAAQLSFATPIAYVEALLQAAVSPTFAHSRGASDGDHVDGDTLRFYEQAAHAGDPEAQYALGMRYAAGLGVPQDYEQSVIWYRAAAQGGLARAQFNLGVMYAFGVGVDRDDREGRRWVQRAAEQGDAEAQYNLGMFYATGTGVDKDDVEAIHWYRRAAAQGFPAAEFSLGHMYRVGRGVAKNEAIAATWFQKGAEHGHPDAQQTLASLYAFGQGVARDFVQAHKWYSIAAALHGPDAKDRAAAAAHMRDIIETRMTPHEIAAAEQLARAWRAINLSRER